MASPTVHRIHIIDSHTGGEPTRIIVRGGPDLGEGPLSERVKIFREKHDAFRSATVNEPRGSDVFVGALLTAPHDKSCDFGVIFFNNVGYLGMCGHGTIGLVVTLAHMGKIVPGSVRIDTPVGPVEARLNQDGSVTLDNVPAYRFRKDVAVQVPGHGSVKGDIAWGGNWFFLIGDAGIPVNLANAKRLGAYASAVKEALVTSGVTGPKGEEIDHIEVFDKTPTADSRNFVLCPGDAYDRSPCGTGTSAKLACLAADGKLAEGAQWVQESVIGSKFFGSYRRIDADTVRPTITGTAFVNAESVFLANSDDPFAWGIL